MIKIKIKQIKINSIKFFHTSILSINAVKNTSEEFTFIYNIIKESTVSECHIKYSFQKLKNVIFSIQHDMIQIERKLSSAVLQAIYVVTTNTEIFRKY